MSGPIHLEVITWPKRKTRTGSSTPTSTRAAAAGNHTPAARTSPTSAPRRGALEERDRAETGPARRDAEVSQEVRRSLAHGRTHHHLGRSRYALDQHDREGPVPVHRRTDQHVRRVPSVPSQNRRLVADSDPFWLPMRTGADPSQAKAPHEFVDYRELLAQFPPPMQAAAVGASNYKLLKAGCVDGKTSSHRAASATCARSSRKRN